MSQLRLYINMAVGTAVVFLAALALNEIIFTQTEFVRGINWVYLPAGIRLLCTLLFGAAGAAGLFLASCISCFYYFFPDDFIRSIVGSVISAIAPYIVYLGARKMFGLKRSLANLTPSRLLTCSVLYALANALLHHIWFALSDSQHHMLEGFLIMFSGDLAGSLIVLYTAKALLALIASKRSI